MLVIIILVGIVAILVIVRVIKYNHSKREQIFKKIERIQKCKK